MEQNTCISNKITTIRASFNRAHYYAIKDEVVELIKASLPDWKTKQGFLADGIYAPDVYENEPLKVLVVLSETYGYDIYGMIDIETQPNLNTKDPKDSHVIKVTTINKIAKLLWLLFKSLKENKEFSKSEVPKTYNNAEKLKAALLKVAWINVKKESGGQSRQNNSEVYSHAQKNKEILSKQIESIAPELIIVCGDIAMHSLCDLNLLGEGIVANKKNQVQINEHGQKIIHLSHPSYFKLWGYDHIFKYYQTIYQGLNPSTISNV